MSRTTLLLDDESKKILVELSEVYGSQTAAIKASLGEAYEKVTRERKRQAYIDWLAEQGHLPSEEDKEWARRIAVEVAALRESQK